MDDIRTKMFSATFGTDFAVVPLEAALELQADNERRLSLLKVEVERLKEELKEALEQRQEYYNMVNG